MIVKLTPALRRRVDLEAAKLAAMPDHSSGWRPVVVVAWQGRKRAHVGACYNHLPVGSALPTETADTFAGYDRAFIVAAR